MYMCMYQCIIQATSRLFGGSWRSEFPLLMVLTPPTLPWPAASWPISLYHCSVLEENGEDVGRSYYHSAVLWGSSDRHYTLVLTALTHVSSIFRHLPQFMRELLTDTLTPHMAHLLLPHLSSSPIPPSTVISTLHTSLLSESLPPSPSLLYSLLQLVHSKLGELW